MVRPIRVSSRHLLAIACDLSIVFRIPPVGVTESQDGRDIGVGFDERVVIALDLFVAANRLQ